MHEAHAAVVVPAGHVARIGMVEMTGAGEAAQYQSAHLRLHRDQVFWCQRGGLGKLNPLAFARSEHPIDHAAVEVRSG